MKFRSKTGEVFENTYEDVTFCGPYKGCIGCPVGNIKQNYDCTEWVNKHPHEAARLMGFKVVEEDEKCATCANQKTVECVTCGALYRNYQEKETDMDKPRICEVLGVDVGEHFYIDGFKGEYHVNSDGVLKWGGQTSCDAIYEAINHPDRIIHKTRWTEQEVEDATHLKKILDSRKIGCLTRRRDDELLFCDNYGKSESVFSSISLCPDMFPSLRPGETVTLDEIIGGAQ